MSNSPISHVMQTRKTTWEQFIQPDRPKAFPPFASSSPQLSAALGFSGQPNMNPGGSPFVSSLHGHPGFNPSKMGGRSSLGNDLRNAKQPKPPEKPLIPYMRYSRKVWEEIRAEYPDVKVYEIGKIIGQRWREMSAQEKQVYCDEFEQEKVEYNQLLKAYHESPAYQAWLASNRKGRSHAETGDRMMQTKQPDGKITIQSVEDDEDPEEFSQKHVAAARYLRNHRLINEIFSETVVPDVRSVVTTARMQTLKRQVQSLTMHQKKLEAELAQIDEKFEQKKRKFLEASEAFQEEMKRRCAIKPVDSATYQKMVEKAMEQLLKEQEERKIREEQAALQKKEEERQAAEAKAAAEAALPATVQEAVTQPQTNGIQGPEEPSQENSSTSRGEDNTQNPSESTSQPSNLTVIDPSMDEDTIPDPIDDDSKGNSVEAAALGNDDTLDDTSSTTEPPSGEESLSNAPEESGTSPIPQPDDGQGLPLATEQTVAQEAEAVKPTLDVESPFQEEMKMETTTSNAIDTVDAENPNLKSTDEEVIPTNPPPPPPLNQDETSAQQEEQPEPSTREEDPVGN